MYCSHCGKKIDEEKLEKKRISLARSEDIDENTSVNYVCPRCGHLIHKHLDSVERKSLSAAGHAEIQIARNQFAYGRSFTSIGGILAVLAIIFFLLARKPAQNFKLVTTCPEFSVSRDCFGLAAILLLFGIVLTVLGLRKKKNYESLLKDINDDVFHQ